MQEYSRFVSKNQYSPNNKLLFNPNFKFMLDKMNHKPKGYDSHLSNILNEYTKEPYFKQ